MDDFDENVKGDAISSPNLAALETNNSLVDSSTTADVEAAIVKNLDGRLLCAANCAYEICAPYFRGAAFLSGTQAKRLARSINTVLIGRTIDGVVLAFRGTMGGSPLDWIQNAGLVLSQRDGLPGKIHLAFYGAVKSVWDPMKEVLIKFLNDSDTKDVFLTGHSKGGALATIAAFMIHNDEELPNPKKVVTFGSSRCGNSGFRDVYNRTITHVAYECHLDMIPFLPPSQPTMEALDQDATEKVDDMLWSKIPTEDQKKNMAAWDYQPVGTRLFIDETGNITDNVTKELDDSRIIDIEEKTILSVSKFRAAHSLSCPGKDGDGLYCLALAPEICESHAT